MSLMSVGVYAIALLMTYVVKQKQFVNSRCEECEVRYVPSFDDLMVLEYKMWTKQAPRQDQCYRLCQLDVPCLSFQYNEVTKLCRGYASGFTSPTIVQTSAENGTKLYVTCRATNHMGSACALAGDCLAPATGCVDGICNCSTDHKYSMHTWSCFKCKSMQDTKDNTRQLFC
ncbi:uncharacterized protein LOC124266339 [Haliotis rubra]|uniref:uncharacterized protein LOC124266339 n=1 Tax=Haliotis rubra TaxID=36100 RepID=UPI001EE5DE92|nr:uncharacterized protein LOC124266339 [Haliotis rubra]